MNCFTYCKKTVALFASSFLPGTNFVYSALVDAIYWFLTFLIAVTAKNYLVAEIYKLQPAAPNPALLANQTAAAMTVSTIKWYFIDSVVIVVVALLVQIIVYSACKGLIWLILLDKKPTKEYFLGFLKLNFIWWLTWLAPLLIIAFGLKANFFAPIAIITLLLYLHLTSILHISFTEKQDIKKAFSKTFMLGIRKAHYFMPPYALSIIFYLIVSQLFRFLPQDQKSMLAAGIIFLIFYMAWFRGYFLEIYKQVQARFI